MKGSRGLQKVKGPFKVFPSFSSEGDADLPQNNFHSPLPGKWKRGFVQKPRLLPILQKKKKKHFLSITKDILNGQKIIKITNFPQ